MSIHIDQLVSYSLNGVKISYGTVVGFNDTDGTVTVRNVYTQECHSLLNDDDHVDGFNQYDYVHCLRGSNGGRQPIQFVEAIRVIRKDSKERIAFRDIGYKSPFSTDYVRAVGQEDFAVSNIDRFVVEHFSLV